ncbi:unnamed protein product [Durusdinium trenchii]|uniref:Vacuolar-sorting protein SNF8 n=2 Tax=Durusdinium trenchii TaxID=1381693 RepID=A0ABP0MBR4_9DINO
MALLFVLVLWPNCAAEVTPEVLAAREWRTWGGPGGAMANAGPASLHPVVKPGDTIFLRAYNGNFLGVRDFKVNAKASPKASAEAFRVEKRSIGDIYHGDRIFLTNTNGFRLEVNGSEVTALSSHMGPRQELVIERNGAMSQPIAVGDTIFLRAHTGNHIDVVGETVKARFPRQGMGYHAFVVEKQPR